MKRSVESEKVNSVKNAKTVYGENPPIEGSMSSDGEIGWDLWKKPVYTEGDFLDDFAAELKRLEEIREGSEGNVDGSKEDSALGEQARSRESDNEERLNLDLDLRYLCEVVQKTVKDRLKLDDLLPYCSATSLANVLGKEHAYDLDKNLKQLRKTKAYCSVSELELVAQTVKCIVKEKVQDFIFNEEDNPIFPWIGNSTEYQDTTGDEVVCGLLTEAVRETISNNYPDLTDILCSASGLKKILGNYQAKHFEQKLIQLRQDKKEAIAAEMETVVTILKKLVDDLL
jgi:hypothetical protein